MRCFLFLTLHMNGKVTLPLYTLTDKNAHACFTQTNESILKLFTLLTRQVRLLAHLISLHFNQHLFRIISQIWIILLWDLIVMCLMVQFVVSCVLREEAELSNSRCRANFRARKDFGDLATAPLISSNPLCLCRYRRMRF